MSQVAHQNICHSYFHVSMTPFVNNLTPSWPKLLGMNKVVKYLQIFNPVQKFIRKGDSGCS